jgi:hypothetical protein
MFGIKKYFVQPIVDGLKYFNNTCATTSGITDSAQNSYTHFTKLVGATTGASGIGKGTVDIIEAVSCADGVCAVVSGIGVGADLLTTFTNFVVGPNVSTVVTIPVSVGCKTFVYCCKRAKLPWRTLCS